MEGEIRSINTGSVVRLLSVFSLGWVVVYAASTTLYPMLPLIGAEFRLTSAEVGTLVSLYFLPYVFVQLASGPLIDRFGTKRVVSVSFLVIGLGLLGLALVAVDYTTTAALVAFYGLGAGTYFPASYAAVANAVPPRILGISSAAMVVGVAVGIMLGLGMAGPVYLATGSWRAPFLVLALPTILVALGFMVLFRDVRPARAQPVALRQMFADRKLLCIYGTFVCSLYGWWVVLTWGPAFFQSERSLGLVLGGLITAVVALAGVPGALLTGRVSDKIGRRRVSLVLFVLAAIAVFALGYVESTPLLLVALVAYGLVGKLAYDPVGFAWIAERAKQRDPNAVATALGAASVSVLISSLTAPVVSGWIRDVTGSFSGAFYVAALVLLIGVPLSLLCDETIEGARQRR